MLGSERGSCPARRMGASKRIALLAFNGDPALIDNSLMTVLLWMMKPMVVLAFVLFTCRIMV
ncbi:hypothetical protein [Brucella pituitosa]|uniref:Uncharacterized protein n=1 Tax=Brucella pituitosa TaxID=571256 RepID=A0ABS3JVQ5_9HYPH|nr:hypothetical protein [Brucella pituitosa]MBO1038727.1 hypothetical protein [Brucella pituitosa]